MKYDKDRVAVWVLFTSIAILIWYFAMGYKYAEEKVRILESGNIEHAIETGQY